MSKYFSPEISKKVFSEEVIAVSMADTPTKDPNAPVELPFIPAQ